MTSLIVIFDLFKSHKHIGDNSIPVRNRDASDKHLQDTVSVMVCALPGMEAETYELKNLVTFEKLYSSS
jgi:hypothetical protein